MAAEPSNVSMLMNDTPIVALVGRPNVGKSALFNRLLGKRLAVVDATSGVTRDRLYAPVEWQGRTFTIVDTGGIDIDSDVDLVAATRAQAQIAIAEADVILFVVDAAAGLTAGDEDVAALLRPSRAKVLLVANKAESPKSFGAIYEFCALGLDVPLPVSAIHGLQSGDLLDAIVAKLPVRPPTDRPEAAEIHVAIVGQPNVGKSSLLNALLGRERAIVSPIAGTTRDATDTAIETDGSQFVLIDTAGIRRHAHAGAPVDYYSSLRAVAAVGRCDVALLLIDATAGPTSQDKRIAGLAVDQGKALAILVNKWDLIDPAKFDRTHAHEAVRSEFPFAPYAAILFGSALTSKGIHKIWQTVASIAAQRRKHVPTARLNQIVRDALRIRPPAMFRGNLLKCYYVTQSASAPPTFVFFVNDPRLVHFSYSRYLENNIREAFDFFGTPIELVFRPRVQQDRTQAEELIIAGPDPASVRT